MIWRKPQKTDKGAGQDIPDAESLREIPADRRHSGIQPGTEQGGVCLDFPFGLPPLAGRKFGSVVVALDGFFLGDRATPEILEFFKEAEWKTVE